MTKHPRPETTLFMLMSVDGKISTGDSDELDVDTDFPKIAGIKEGLYQYYDLEKRTDLFSLNSGRVQAKIGINARTGEVDRLPVSFILIDSKPHLQASGIEYLLKRGKALYVVTTNKHHPAFAYTHDPRLKMITHEGKIDFAQLFATLREQHGVDRMTIQTGGTLNAILLREGLIDHVSIVVAPALIGGKDTATLIDGESLHTQADLHNIRPLTLTKCTALEHSYVHLEYDVVNK